MDGEKRERVDEIYLFYMYQINTEVIAETVEY